MTARFQNLLIALLLASCASRNPNVHLMESGVVERVTMDMRQTGGTTPFWSALWLAAIGSGIGTGATAHAIGAGGGALLGGGLGYAHDRRVSRNSARTVEVLADSGTRYLMRDSGSPPVRPGQRVWVALDSRGRSERLISGQPR